MVANNDVDNNDVDKYGQILMLTIYIWCISLQASIHHIFLQCDPIYLILNMFILYHVAAKEVELLILNMCYQSKVLYGPMQGP